MCDVGHEEGEDVGVEAQTLDDAALHDKAFRIYDMHFAGGGEP